MFKKIFDLIIKHKIRTILILVVVIFAGYFGYKKFFTNTALATNYVLNEVSKGTLIISLSGAGQVSASNQVDIKPEASGKITGVYAKVGDEVKAGALLVQLDASDALKNVRDAKTSLETAKLELEDTLNPVDELTLLQSENSLSQAKQNLEDSIDNLSKSYEDGFNNVANLFLDLPTIMTGLNDILYSYSFNSSQTNLDYYSNAIKFYNYDSGALYYDDAVNKYQFARTAYDQNFLDYKKTSRFDTEEKIENLISESYETTKKIAEAVKSINNLLRLYQDILVDHDLTPQSLSTTHLTNLSSYTSKTNTYLTSLLSSRTSVETNKDNISDAQESIKEKELSLVKTKSGSDELTIRAKKITVQQKEDALLSAQETLADYSIRASFDGILASFSAKKGDTASQSSSIATIITKQKIAEITLNEVDVAKVAVGQKANLTFDAVDNLNITGLVVEVDTLGAVSQGVVSYKVKINFDTEDERIKSGMSVTANIITTSKQDVLIIPNSAIKTANGVSCVEMPDEEVVIDNSNSVGVTLSKPVKNQTIEVGLSSDTSAEVVSGLVEGDKIIVRTINSNITSSSTTKKNTTPVNNSSRQNRNDQGPGVGGEMMRIMQ